MPLPITSEVKTISYSPEEQCWRLIHDGKYIICMFESAGQTATINNLFCGTQDECNIEIARLNLVPKPKAEKFNV